MACLQDRFVVNNNTKKAEHQCNYPILKLGDIADKIMSAISLLCDVKKGLKASKQQQAI
jgi:hypothetical protein